VANPALVYSRLMPVLICMFYLVYIYTGWANKLQGSVAAFVYDSI